jgi:hypothetical protein
MSVSLGMMAMDLRGLLTTKKVKEKQKKEPAKK